MVVLNKTIIAQITTITDDKSAIEIDQTEDASNFFHYSLKIPLWGLKFFNIYDLKNLSPKINT